MISRRGFLYGTASGAGYTLVAKDASAIVRDSVGITIPLSLDSHRSSVARFPYFRSTPVSYLRVRMHDRLWAPRQKTVRDVTVSWATRHYDYAGGLEGFKDRPLNYTAGIKAGDLESIKFIEAMASVVGLRRDEAIEQLTDSWGKLLIDAQSDDGYSVFGHPSGADPAKRWQPAWYSHEDYALGHYVESAIAYLEATGNAAMYRSAVRAADNMVSRFLGSNHAYAPGHPEIEQALMRLYGVTGERRYLQLCGWLINQRGRHEGRQSFGKYSQDHLPIKQQRTIEGHAVRAAFLFNGVTEYVGATGDAEYREAVLAIWDDLVSNKLYLHGASGNQSAKNEGYTTKRKFLPPDDTYGESCAVFANFQWAQNLFRLTGDARYIDTAERMLYNAFHASLSLTGDRFFYRNVSQSEQPTLRYEWHSVPCCPPNIVKLFCKVGGFFYSTDREGIFVKHYGANEAHIPWGRGVKLIQRTDYPWNGHIALQVETKSPITFALRLRVPAWAKSHDISLNGTIIHAPLQNGWIAIKRRWITGDSIELTLPMDIERITMPPQLKEYANLVALQRGPIVYCFEEQDSGAGNYYSYLPADAEFTAEHRLELLGGVTVLKGNLRQQSANGDETLTQVMLIPYGFWNNRKAGWMRIWLHSKKLSIEDIFPGGDPPGAESDVC